MRNSPTALVDELGEDRNVTATAGTRADCATQAGNDGASARSVAPRAGSSRLTLRDGTPLRLVLRPQPDFSWSRPHSSRWLLYVIVLPLCLGMLAYVVARMATRPLGRLARAATALGGDINQPPLPEKWPVRGASMRRWPSTRCRRAFAATSRNEPRCLRRSHTICRRRLRVCGCGWRKSRTKTCATSSSPTWARCRA